MPRTFTEHSKNYLKQYFKTRYDNDSDFRKQVNQSNNVSRHRTRLSKKLEMITLEILADCYVNYKL